MTAVNLPETYLRYQEFLPEFNVTTSLVLNSLTAVYNKFIEEGGIAQIDGEIQLWLNQNNVGNTSQSYYDSLRESIDDTLSRTGVSYTNEAFLSKIEEECFEYGFEEWENPSEIIVEETYSVRTALVDEIQNYVEFLNISELG